MGWSLFSWGQSDQDVNKNCLKKDLVAELNRNCQFLSAAQLQKNLILEIAPELKDEINIPEGTKNYGPESCRGGVADVEVEKVVEKVVTITEFIPAPSEKKIATKKKTCKAHKN